MDYGHRLPLSPKADLNCRKYERNELKNIRSLMTTNSKLGTLSPTVVKRIRELKIHKKRRRGRRGGRSRMPLLSNNVNNNNLITVACDSFYDIRNPYTKIKFGVTNARSIKGKDVALAVDMISLSLDFVLITETWIKPGKDDYWLHCCDLNVAPLSISSSPRIAKSGGGIALVINDLKMEAKLEYSKIWESFEAAIWTLKHNTKTFTVFGIYHPPSSASGHTNQKFIDEFVDFLEENLPKFSNIIIMGDFNIHINKPEINDNMQFIDILQALNLQQWIPFSTHKDGNILDLIISEDGGIMTVTNVTQQHFISDHRLITAHLNIDSSKVEMKRITYRKLKDIQPHEITANTDFDSIIENPHLHLDDIISEFDNQISNMLSTLAPLKSKTFPVRDSRAWYTDELRLLKKSLRNRELIWRKYGKKDEHWTAYKEMRKVYYNKLRWQRSSYMREQIKKHRGDSKFLYKLASELCGIRKLNPMPEGTDEDLSKNLCRFLLKQDNNYT